MNNVQTEKGESLAFPYQKRSIAKKGESFMKKCVDAGISLTVLNNDEGHRSSRENKMSNYDLANGIIDKRQMYRQLILSEFLA